VVGGGKNLAAITMYCSEGFADNANGQQSKEEQQSVLPHLWRQLWIQNLVIAFPPCENSESVRKSVAIRYENLI
jgi:hypothetical protein